MMLIRWIERCESITETTLVLAILCGLTLSTLDASEPQSLHARIDQLISRSHVGPDSSAVSDAEFVRRVYLDLIGRVPAVDEARAFLADVSANKRAKLVDNLLSRDEANRHLAVVFDVWMMERRADQHVTTDQWREYLYRSFADGKSYGQLSREILTARDDDELKPAAKFYLDRDAETHSMTRDVSRVFFGRDVQCAQCHDHPLITDYLQTEYYGLFSFLNRSFLFQDEKDKKKVALAERAEGEATFSSVFEPDSEKTTAVPALPDGAMLDDEPQFVPGEGYRVKPAKNVRPVPKYSRREHFAKLATGGESEAFKRNIANRLWRHMMGRGLVEPPDLHHSDNPSAYPELLRLLADEFDKLEFDVKAFLREVALTDVYQRAIDLPMDVDLSVPGGMVDDLRAQLGFQQSVVKRVRQQVRDLSIHVNAARLDLKTTKTELASLLDSIGKANKTRAESNAELAKAEKEIAEKKVLANTIQTAADAAAKAADQLKDDTALASAAKIFGDRTKKIASDLAELEKKVAGLKASHTENLSNCENLEQQVAPLEARRAEVLRNIGRRSGAEQALRRQLDAENDRHLDLSQRIEAIETVIQYDTHQKSRLALASRHEELASQQSGLETQRQQLTSNQRELQSRIAQLRDSIENESDSLQDAQQLVDSHRSLVESVQVAAEQTEKALRTLVDDPDLAQAHQTLVSRVQQLTTKANQLESSARNQEAKVANLQQKALALEAKLSDQRSRLTQFQQQIAELETVVADVQEQRVQADALVKESRERLMRLWKERFVVSSLKPLTPEQMASSLVHALGLEQRFRAEAEAEWKKNNEEKNNEEKNNEEKNNEEKNNEEKNNEEKKDAELSVEQRQQQIGELYAKREQQVVSACVSLFASSPGSPQDVFHATIDQALFFANDGRVRDWLRATPGSLSKRLAEISDDRLVAEELYLSVLSRKPFDDEVLVVAEYLGDRSADRAAAQQELIWSMVTSLEFRFNH